MPGNNVGDGKGISWRTLDRDISALPEDSDMQSSTSCRHLSEVKQGRIGKDRMDKNEDDCEGKEDNADAKA